MEIEFTPLSTWRWSVHGPYHNLLGVIEYTPARGYRLWADCYFSFDIAMLKEIMVFCESQEKIEKEKNAGRTQTPNPERTESTS